MAPPRLLVLLNPNASRAAASAATAMEILTAAGCTLTVRPTQSAAELVRAVVEDGQASDAVVIAGGDGTINCALAGLLELGRPVGILPLGTANDLALTLGIPADIAEAAAVIIAGNVRRIDVGKVNDRHFLNVASLGLSVAIAEQQDPETKRQWGILSYAIAALRTLSDATRFRATIDCNGSVEEVEAFQIAVGNGVHYGGGLKVAEDASIDDGFLDVYALESRTIADMLTAAPALGDGSLGRRDDVRTFRCRSVRIATDEPMPVNTDGEVSTETPAEFSVLRGALAIFAPPPG